MTKALLDTTLVHDQLLGPQTKRKAAKKLVGEYDTTRTVTYAFRELRSGALGTWILAYNTLVDHDTVEEALAHMQAIGFNAPRKGQVGATALMRSLEAAANAPRVPEQDARLAALAFLGDAIVRAWNDRKSTAAAVTHPLPCFVQGKIELDGEHLRPSAKSGALGCEPNVPCGAAAHLKGCEAEIQILVEALRPKSKGEVQKKELSNIRSALKEVLGNSPENFPRKKCRALGDAYFCLLAAKDEDIATTNKGDYEVLTKPLNKKSVNP